MRRILIIRLSSIGDIVLTSPVIRSLRARYPDADIRFLAKAHYADLLSPNPNLSGVMLFDGRLRHTVRQVRAFRPDIIIDLHHNLRTALIKSLSGTKSLSFPKLNIEKWLLVRMRFAIMPEVHITERYMRTVTSLGAVYDGQGLDFFIPPDVVRPKLPEGFSQGYVAVAVGAKLFTKRIPEHKLIGIIRQLGLPAVLLGDRDDMAAGSRIAEATGALSLCGQCSLLQSARVLEEARAVVAGDTGLMHIAAALRRPLVSVWGSTVPQFGMTPLFPDGEESKSVIIEREGLKCRPCSKIGYAKCPKGHFRCMEEMRPEVVSREVSRLCASA